MVDIGYKGRGFAWLIIKSSYRIWAYLQSIGKTLEEKYYLSTLDYAVVGGAFPIFIKNVGMVGTITVSGLPHDEDHGMVVRVLKEFLSK